ncbi:unnamed protein product [Linum tenue]|uniref:Uncharacterized protein n=1 Tax=Linum tenue TaxID=586396 RepID=A0AAV0NTJ7_9ROSI|nr:unnamed protein product [Linum tenue]
MFDLSIYQWPRQATSCSFLVSPASSSLFRLVASSIGENVIQLGNSETPRKNLIVVL